MLALQLQIQIQMLFVQTSFVYMSMYSEIYAELFRSALFNTSGKQSSCTCGKYADSDQSSSVCTGIPA